MRILSDTEKDTAGPWAPSRNVVSYTTIRLTAPLLWLDAGCLGIKKPPGLCGREVLRRQRSALKSGDLPRQFR
jgi:hypothetical protein